MFGEIGDVLGSPVSAVHQYIPYLILGCIGQVYLSSRKRWWNGIRMGHPSLDWGPFAENFKQSTEKEAIAAEAE